MKINPFAMAKGEYIWEYYPFFSRTKLFHDVDGWKEGVPDSHIPDQVKELYAKWGEDELNLILQYLVILVDRESPIAEVTDMKERVSAAKKVCGIPGKEDFRNRVNAVIDGDEDYYHSLVSQYFKQMNQIQYENWFTLKLTYHHISEMARVKPVDMEKSLGSRARIMKELESMYLSVVSAEHALFPSEGLARIIAQKQNEDSIGGWPEKMARRKPWDTEEKAPQEEYDLKN